MIAARLDGNVQGLKHVHFPWLQAFKGAVESLDVQSH